MSASTATATHAVPEPAASQESHFLRNRLNSILAVLPLGAGHAEAFADIAHEMHFNGPTLPVYLLGTLGVAYHLGNGLSSIGMGWGLATSQKAMRRWELFGLLIFGVLLVMSWAALYGIW